MFVFLPTFANDIIKSLTNMDDYPAENYNS